MTPNETFYCVGIGASAGGNDALFEFFTHLSPGTSAAYFLATQLPRYHKVKLIEIIRLRTQMRVMEVNGLMDVLPSFVYIPPENALLSFATRTQIRPIKINVSTINSSIDTFFFSLAESHKSHAIGVILSGGDRDGADGALAIHNAGGKVIVQSPASSEFKAMPEGVIDKDHPCYINVPEMLASKVAELVSVEL